jgi:hypothetical protein
MNRYVTRQFMVGNCVEVLPLIGKVDFFKS